jgi:hypothetical protein
VTRAFDLAGETKTVKMGTQRSLKVGHALLRIVLVVRLRGCLNRIIVRRDRLWYCARRRRWGYEAH